MEFPNAVGMDVQRAISHMKQKLGRTRVYFKEMTYKPNRKNNTSISCQPNEILLWIDEKWNCVAKTPVFKGVVISEQNEGEYYSDND